MSIFQDLVYKTKPTNRQEFNIGNLGKGKGLYELTFFCKKSDHAPVGRETYAEVQTINSIGKRAMMNQRAQNFEERTQMNMESHTLYSLNIKACMLNYSATQK